MNTRANNPTVPNHESSVLARRVIETDRVAYEGPTKANLPKQAGMHSQGCEYSATYGNKTHRHVFMRTQDERTNSMSLLLPTPYSKLAIVVAKSAEELATTASTLCSVSIPIFVRATSLM